jgi:CheY-like chemotaxis protein
VIMKETRPDNTTPITVVLMDIESPSSFCSHISLGTSADAHFFAVPVMDGLTAIRELRRREAAGEVPHRYVRSILSSPSRCFFVCSCALSHRAQGVIAVTGNAREGQQAECRAAGFDDVSSRVRRFA